MSSDLNTTLLEREYAGLRVRVDYLPIMQMGTLNVECNGQQMAATVPTDRLLDAFAHPMLYLSEPQVQTLGV